MYHFFTNTDGECDFFWNFGSKTQTLHIFVRRHAPYLVSAVIKVLPSDLVIDLLPAGNKAARLVASEKLKVKVK